MQFELFLEFKRVLLHLRYNTLRYQLLTASCISLIQLLDPQMTI